MSDRTPEPGHRDRLEPRPAFSLFHVLTLLLTLFAAIGIAVLIGARFGRIWGCAAFLFGGVLAFYPFAYASWALAFFLHRRYTTQCRIGYEAACFLLACYSDETPPNKPLQPTSGGDSPASRRSD